MSVVAFTYDDDGNYPYSYLESEALGESQLSPRTCKNGESCQYFLQGNCKFTHTWSYGQDEIVDETNLQLSNLYIAPPLFDLRSDGDSKSGDSDEGFWINDIHKTFQSTKSNSYKGVAKAKSSNKAFGKIKFRPRKGNHTEDNSDPGILSHFLNETGIFSRHAKKNSFRSKITGSTAAKKNGSSSFDKKKINKDDKHPALSEPQRLKNFVIQKNTFDKILLLEEKENDAIEDYQCTCQWMNSFKIGKEFMGKISMLPNILQNEILKRMDIEDLIRLDLSSNTLALIFNLPSKINVQSWFINYVLKQKRGIIYVPQNHQFFINQLSGRIGDIEEEDAKIAKSFINVMQFDPGVEPGFYKFRGLPNGFDLVKVGNAFMSSECGPKECFPGDEAKWTETSRARGFVTEKNEVPQSKRRGTPYRSEVWKVPLLGKLDLDRERDSVVFISTNKYGGLWTNQWQSNDHCEFSVGSQMTKKTEESLSTTKYTKLQLITTKNSNYVLGYAILFQSTPVNTEENRSFTPSVSTTKNLTIHRYYQRGKDEAIGLLVTGNATNTANKDTAY